MDEMTTTKTRCRCCGSAGSLFIRGAIDHVYHVPGDWNFRRCEECDSLWIDPPPPVADIPSFYPASYGFIRAIPDNPLLKGVGMAHQVKLSILAKAYGYTDLQKQVSSPWASAAGAVLSRSRRMRRKAGFTVRFLNFKRGGRLLDIGCGNGGFVRLMGDLGWKAEGMEPDPEAVAVARGAGLVVSHGTIEDCELPPETYDAMTMHHVMEHLVDLKAAVRRVAGSLKVGGTFVSISPNPMGLAARWFGRDWRALEPPRHLALPTSEGYRQLFNDMGFSLELFTSMRTAYWALQDSISIQETGKMGAPARRLKTKLLHGFAGCSMSFRPDGGEEVICVATKRSRSGQSCEV